MDDRATGARAQLGGLPPGWVSAIPALATVVGFACAFLLSELTAA